MAGADDGLRTPRAARTAARHVLTMIAGWGCLAVGAALLVLPGPGIPLVLVGLALLAVRHSWARRALDALKDRARRLAFRREMDRATIPTAPAAKRVPHAGG